jgi:hypothetical protein
VNGRGPRAPDRPAWLGASAIGGLGALAPHDVVGGGLLAAAATLVAASHKAFRLARRARVGSDAEDAARSTLDRLADEGWDVSHGADWPGGGDIDHLVRSPGGLGFAIETKTWSFNRRQLDRTMYTARWAAGQRWRYPRGRGARAVRGSKPRTATHLRRGARGVARSTGSGASQDRCGTATGRRPAAESRLTDPRGGGPVSARCPPSAPSASCRREGTAPCSPYPASMRASPGGQRPVDAIR